MPELNDQSSSEHFAQPISRRWVVLALLVAVAFISGVGASSQERFSEVRSAVIETPDEVVAAFAPISIDELPVHEPDDESPSAREADSDGASVLEVGRIVVTKGELSAGRSLSAELRKHGISRDVIEQIDRYVGPVFDFRHSRPGDAYRLALDSASRLVDFRYSLSAEESVYLFWDGESYVARREQAELEARIAILAGMVETSLYDSIRGLGEFPELADDFAEIFAWDIDFTLSERAGDEFRMLYERLYLTDDDGREIYVRPGRIMAAQYRGADRHYAAVYFETGSGQGNYFRPDGTSVERPFLAAPLRYSRISSTFSHARLHPILNVTRPHLGVDYAAAEGTPLWSVASGKVIFRGHAGDSGNLVKIRHKNGYVSHYAHLAQFSDGLRVGSEVRQKQVIGYVGQTGLATGSHVCFRLTSNGRYMNPLEIESEEPSPVDPLLTTDFARTRDRLMAYLDVRTAAAAQPDRSL
jgi:murein DD-endopeptidase MepM/ murein hydrolase activator NlpD